MSVTKIKIKIKSSGIALILLSMFFVMAGCSSDSEPVPGIKVSEQTLTTSEDGTTAEFTVVLNAAPGSDVIIPVVSLDEGEVSVSPASLTFTNTAGATPWNVPQVVTVTGVDDFDIDGNQTVTVELQAAIAETNDYLDLDPDDVEVQNSDNDTAGVTISEGTTIFPENGGTGSFTIVLNTIPLNDVVIDITSQDTTEADVSLSQITFTATDWNVPQTIDLTGVADYIIDGNQTFDIAIAINASTVDTTGYAELLIPPVTITTSDGDTAGFTVSKTTLNTSEAGVDDTFTVVLNTIPDGSVTLVIASTDLTEAIVKETVLIFTSADWNSAKLVNVYGVEDALIDGNQTFDVTLTIIGEESSDTTGYASLMLPAISTTNADNDAAGFTIIGGPITSAENGSVQTFTIKPNTQPLTGNTIDVSIISTDVLEGTVSPASLSWSEADWTTAKIVTVTPIDDFVADGNIAYSIQLDPASSTETPYQTVGIQAVAVTNSDDEIAGFTIIGSPVTTTEGGGNKSFTIQPNTEPLTGVTVSIVSTDTTEGTVSPSSYSWSSADWLSGKTITVAPVDETEADGSITYNVELDPATSADVAYASLGVQVASVTNVDNESPYVSWVAPSEGAMDLALAGMTFSVSFDMAMTVASITTNTADTTCSGSLQVSKDNFATCVQMSTAPVAGVSDTFFTVTPLADLKVGVYHVRVTTAATESVNGWALGEEFNTVDGLATIPAVGLPISVNNTNADTLTDFQVRVVLDATFDWTDFSSTGDEVRFYNGANELSYYVESYDQATQTAVYWVKVDSLAAKAVTGLTLVPFDAGLSAVSNGKTTFAFFDGFDGTSLDTTVWNNINTTEGNYSVSGGVLTLTGAPTDSWVNSGNFFVGATDLAGLVASDAFTADARILRTALDGHWYANSVRASSSNYYSHIGLWLRHGVPYNYEFAGAANTGAWRVYQVKVDALNAITYDWGSVFGSWDNTLTESRVPGATFDMSFSMDGYSNTGVTVDYVRVRKHADIDPVVSY